ncbi:MAG: response regulator [Bacteroidota bacterium]
MMNTYVKTREHVKMNLLLIEDHPGDIMLTEEALKDPKIPQCNLNVVSDGEEALDYLSQSKGFEEAIVPDLIIMDLNIPKKDGQEVLTFIKNHDRLKTIPVVIFSTSDSEQDVNRSYHLRANCYVTKPVDYDEFVLALSGIINFWQLAERPPIR